MKKMLFVACAISSVAMTGSVLAQGYGDARRGQTVARQVCAQCHAVGNFPATSPNPDAPSFYSLAQRPEMTELGLYMAIRTPHDDMPSLVPDVADLHNVIAYVQSLGRRQ